MATWTVVVCLMAIGFSAVIASQDSIPALLWTNTKSDFPVPLAGHTTRQDEFKNDYLQNNFGRAGHTLVAFSQDKLSLEDIIDNADVYNEESTGAKFANLKRLVETHTSVHLPAVYQPGKTVEKLANDFKGKVHHLKESYKMAHVTLDPSVANFVIVHLPQNDGKSFDKIDEIIGYITDELKSMDVPFTAVYTGYEPTQVHKEEVYTGRHLLQSGGDEGTLLNVSSCILMFYEKLRLTVAVKDKIYSYVLEGGDTAGSSCQNDSGKLTVKYPKQQDLESFSLTMVFKLKKSGFWHTSLKMSYNIVNDSTTVSGTDVAMKTSMIYAPAGFSYHCSSPYPLKQDGKSNTTGNAWLSISELQVQYDRKGMLKAKFGPANDCEGFFSAPIWSGLVAALIMAIILGFGISMIMSISTMDRFDDPKGKTISVTAGD